MSGHAPTHENNADSAGPAASGTAKTGAELYPVELEEREAKRVRLRRAAIGATSMADSPPERLPDDTLGLALSGGGIRSATFCLGVLQTLARTGWLDRVDFLSTVSGGGYIGSFLGRMFNRRWAAAGRSVSTSAVRDKIADSDSEPMTWLRNHGRYLSPNRGGDAWLAVATVLRNWIAVVSVLLTLGFAVFSGLTLLRAVLWRYQPYVDHIERPLIEATAGYGLWWSPLVVVGAVALVFLVVPTWAYWLTQTTWSDLPAPVRWLHERVAPGTTWLMVVASLVAVSSRLSGRFTVSPVLFAIAVPMAAWGLSALGLHAALRHMSKNNDGSEEAASAPETTEHQRRKRGLPDTYLVRNQLSRMLAFGLEIVVALFGVAVIDSLGQSVYAYMTASTEAGAVATLFGAVVAMAALVAAGAQKIASLLEMLPKGRAVRVPAKLLAGFVGVTLAVLLLTAVAIGAHAVAWGGGPPMPTVDNLTCNPGAVLFPFLGDDDQRPNPIVCGAMAWSHASSGSARGEERPRLRASLIAVGTSWVLSLLIGQILAFFNLSSLHAFYAARLSRAYLGASNRVRWDGSGEQERKLWFRPSPRRVGDPHKDDDCDWCRYKPWRHGGPLHIVNMTLNETVGGKSQVEYRDRKGLSFAVGPCGISVGRHDHGLWGRYGDERQTGGRGRSYLTWITPIGARKGMFHALGLAIGGGSDSRFGRPNQCERAKLGRYIAISGAAVTTGLGEQTSFGTSLLMGLFNVRLGYWWTSGVSYRQRVRAHACSPQRVMSRFEAAVNCVLPLQAALISELSARFHGPVHRRWYLSDGGHYEVTGVYELLRRRVPRIIACDCGHDRDFGFGDIANLARKVRIDFGAELEILAGDALGSVRDPDVIKKLFGTPASFGSSSSKAEGADVPRRSTKHALLAWVDFEGKSFADRTLDERKSGVGSLIIFLKPSLNGDEPVDLLRYQDGHPDFPNQTTADQFFDEAQWESYRKLGEHISAEILGFDVFSAVLPAATTR